MIIDRRFRGPHRCEHFHRRLAPVEPLPGRDVLIDEFGQRRAAAGVSGRIISSSRPTPARPLRVPDHPIACARPAISSSSQHPQRIAAKLERTKEGRVTDLATGCPIAARVRLERIERQPRGSYRYKVVAQTAANAHGRWVLKQTPTGWHRVVVGPMLSSRCARGEASRPISPGAISGDPCPLPQVECFGHWLFALTLA
jgi:hypothetical protein